MVGLLLLPLPLFSTSYRSLTTSLFLARLPGFLPLPRGLRQAKLQRDIGKLHLLLHGSRDAYVERVRARLRQQRFQVLLYPLRIGRVCYGLIIGSKYHKLLESTNQGQRIEPGPLADIWGIGPHLVGINRQSKPLQLLAVPEHLKMENQVEGNALSGA